MKTEDVPRSILPGLNQTKKAIQQKRVTKVLVACDADPSIMQTVETLCRENGVTLEHAEDMKALGALCGIDVGCAVCAYLA